MRLASLARWKMSCGNLKVANGSRDWLRVFWPDWVVSDQNEVQFGPCAAEYHSRPRDRLILRPGGGSISIDYILHFLTAQLSVCRSFECAKPPKDGAVPSARDAGGGKRNRTDGQKDASRRRKRRKRMLGDAQAAGNVPNRPDGRKWQP